MVDPATAPPTVQPAATVAATGKVEVTNTPDMSNDVAETNDVVEKPDASVDKSVGTADKSSSDVSDEPDVAASTKKSEKILVCSKIIPQVGKSLCC